MPKRIYIAGSMTGKPEYNYPAFHAAAVRLRKQGHFVLNPAEISGLFGTPEEIAASFEAFYDADIAIGGALASAVTDADLAAVRSCDAIYLLRGWEKSRGAKKELAEAIAHGLQVVQEGGAE